MNIWSKSGEMVRALASHQFGLGLNPGVNGLTVFRETKRNEMKRNETKRNETKRNEMKIKKILHKQKGTMALRIIPGLSTKTVLARWRRIGYRRNKALVR